jgi:hypothetical protein
MKTYSNTILVDKTDVVSYQISFSTAEIQDQLFYSEYSPSFSAIEQEPETQQQFKLIGDELMELDMNNLPPSASLLEENHLFFKIPLE